MDTPSNLDFSLFYKAFRRFVGILPWNTCFKIMKKGSKTAISSKGYPHSTDTATKTAKSPVSMWKSNCKKLQLLPFAYSKAELLPYICPIDSRFISKFFLSHVRGNPCIYHSTLYRQEDNSLSFQYALLQDSIHFAWSSGSTPLLGSVSRKPFSQGR